MLKNIFFLVAVKLKSKKRLISTQGFTLIEILVALVIAVLVITPLLGLAVNLLDTDRKEQAKATSEQEIQAAADFIARDLQQAVFIYDPVKGLTRDNSGTPTDSGIRNQIPPNANELGGCRTANCVPVLAFWKRTRVTDAIARDSAASNNSPGTNCQTANDTQKLQDCDDTFVYSLVVYYLIRAENNEATWSRTARIGRFEITDGVRNLRGQLEADARSRKKRNTGFKLFDLSTSAPTTADKMNSWTRVPGSSYTATSDAVGATAAARMEILADYIDRTEVDDGQSEKKFQTCPVDLDSNNVNRWTRTKPDTTPKPSPGFYVCVNTEKNIARVFLRGDAWARIQPTFPNNQDYSNDALKKLSSYMPTATAEVRGVGELRQ